MDNIAENLVYCKGEKEVYVRLRGFDGEYWIGNEIIGHIHLEVLDVEKVPEEWRGQCCDSSFPTTLWVHHTLVISKVDKVRVEPVKPPQEVSPEDEAEEQPETSGTQPAAPQEPQTRYPLGHPDYLFADPDRFDFGSSTPSEMIVRRYRAAGVNVMPCERNGSKFPPRCLKWGVWKQRTINESEIFKFWANRRPLGICVPCGSTSGNLEVLDVDDRDLYEPLIARLPADLVAKLVIVRTGGLKRQLWYRCENIAGSGKLAMRPNTDQNGNRKDITLIETKGEGGLVVAPGSPADCHPSKNEYLFIQGCPETIPTLTIEERSLLIEAGKSFDERRPEEVKEWVKREPLEGDQYDDPDTPWGDFNQRASWEQILAPKNWSLAKGDWDEGKVTRPGKDPKDGHSATIGYQGLPILKVFTASSQFEVDGVYKKAAAFSLLYHNGDFSEAAKELVEMGYGKVGRERERDADRDRRLHQLFEERRAQDDVLLPPEIKVNHNTDDHFAKYRIDPMYDYLWKGRHGLRLLDEDRLRRIRSQEDVFHLIPKTGFFPQYLRTHMPTTDAPVIFHLASALSLASLLLNRKVAFWDGGLLYPNLWINTLAPSSATRKSKALSGAERILEEDVAYRKTIFGTKFTYESFMNDLGRRIEPSKHEHTTVEMSDHIVADLDEELRMRQAMGGECLEGVGIFHAHETASMLQVLNNSANLGMKEDLVKYYDPHREWRKNTMTKGMYLVFRPFINILAASTVEWLTRNLESDDMASGFLPRFLFFPCDLDDSDFLLTRPEMMDQEEKDKLDNEVALLKLCHGHFDLCAEADDFYHVWRKEFQKRAVGDITPWISRMGTTAFKIALIFEASVSGGSMPPSISLDSMRQAANLIDYLADRLTPLLGQMAFGADEKDILKVEKIIRREKELTHSALLKKSKQSVKVFKPVIDTLKERESILVEEETTQGRTKKVYKWVGT